jgi:hypothetical protein
MTASELLIALDLPTATRVQQRVPKKLLLENGAPTAADKRAINDGIEEIQWLAALKPANIGIPAYQDETREYLEIAVLHVSFRPAAKTARLTELIHRAVPYPTVLLATQGADTVVSLAHKRWAQNETAKTVLDGELLIAPLAHLAPDIQRALELALPLALQPRVSMLSLYQGWIDTLLALLASDVTGSFRTIDSADQMQRRRQGLDALRTVDAQITALRAASGKTSQMARQVEINLQLQQLRRDRAAAIDDLQGTP